VRNDQLKKRSRLLLDKSSATSLVRRSPTIPTPKEYRFRLRLDDEAAAELARQADAVVAIWEQVNQVQFRWRWRALTVMELLRSLDKKIDIKMDVSPSTIFRTVRAYYDARQERRKDWSGRRTDAPRIPFGYMDVVFVDDGSFVFHGIKLWPTRKWRLPTGLWIGPGEFEQDARGRWHIRFTVQGPRPGIYVMGDEGTFIPAASPQEARDLGQAMAEAHWRSRK
jgi:hypothetical protein